MSSGPLDPPEASREEALADEEARRLAQTEFERPVVLEAGAGTGKTTTLVARVLAWSLGPGWEKAEAEIDAEDEDERVAVRVLSGVVGLTFTEAAAAEMAARVGRELSRLATGKPPPAWLRLNTGDRPLLASELWRLRARALVSALDHLTLTTIHAWCLGLLSTYPLEANLHPRLTVDADGRRVDEVVAETVETALGRAYGSESHDSDGGEEDREGDVFLELAARGQGPGEIADALGILLLEGLAPEDLGEDPGSPETCRELQRRLADRGRALASSATVRLEAGKRVGKAQDTVRTVRDLLSRLDDLEGGSEEGTGEGEPEPGELEELARGFPDKALDLLRKWGRGRFTKSEAEALGDAGGDVSEAAGELSDLLRHAAGLELLSLAHRALVPLLRTAGRGLRSQGVVTFQDLLTATARLLGGTGAIQQAVVSRVRRAVDQLLVDEFQDTDILQCRILRALALEGPQAERPGLFLVGDPKQSIYGWRNADLAAYGSFVREVEAAGGVRKPLLTSFRSPPALLDEVTRIVEPVMEETPDLQPPFEPLLPWEERKGAELFTAGGRRPVEQWISWRAPAAEDGGDGDRNGTGADTRNADADVVEAEAIARDLWDLHHRHGTDWRSAAILFRSSTQLEPYLEALRRVGVPFQVSGDRQYYRRREVIEAAALVRAVLDPGDHLALLTLLRSSMVGVPDAALLPLWRRELPRRVLELTGDEPREAEAVRLEELAREIRDAAGEVPEGIPGLDRLSGWPDALIAALERLARARRSFRRDPVDIFVARLRDLFLPEPVEAARYLGAYRLANLERFFRTLAEGLEEGGDAGAVLRLLRRSVAEALEAPQSPPPEGASDAVQVLTIHSAKGLEFDHVYFVQLHRGGGSGGFRGTEVLRHGGRVALRLLGADGPGFAELDERRRRVEAAEQIRLLYVAVTRAKRRLVLTGSRGGRSGGRGKAMAELLEERQDSPASLEGLWERARENGEAIRDDQGVLWRFPAVERREQTEESDPRTRRISPPPGLPTPEQVARDAERLEERRSRAARRQERPLSGAASEEAHARLRDVLGAAADEEDPGETASPPSDRGERRHRMEVGSAVHAVLEQLDLERLATGELAAEMEYRRQALQADLARRLPSADLAAARERAEGLIRRFEEGPLAAKLASLADSVVARELPVLLPPREEDEDRSPLGFVAGAVDLLYRDPRTGNLVVVDYKTDEVETEEEILARAGAYAPQGELYRRAVQEALRLPTPPRFELWFLHPGRVVGMG